MTHTRWIVVVAALCGSHGAHAGGVSVFTERMYWELAIEDPIFTEDFETAPLGTVNIGSTTLGSLEFITDNLVGDFAPAIEDPAGFAQNDVNGSRQLIGAVGGTFVPDTPTFNRFVLPERVSAFGMDLASAASGAGITLSFGEYSIDASDYLTGGGDGFLGVILETGEQFDEVTITPTNTPTEFGEGFGLDDFSFVIPAPGTLTLGVGAALFVPRRRG